ncbi:MAG: hypothetical protein U0800_12520 [Isosphaeraceae bacterium]
MQTLTIAALLMIALLALKRAENRKRPLRRRLSRWTRRFSAGPESDPFTKRDLVKSISIMGAAGSGKTSSSGFQIGRAAVRHRDIGGLIIASKPEDRVFWQGVFEACGRLDDLIIFGPDTDHAFDFIAFEKGDARDVTDCILTVAETLSRQGGDSQDPFWVQQQRRTIHNAAEVLRLAHGAINTWDLQRFINDAAISQEMFESETWQAGFHNASLALAFQNAHTDRDVHDLNLAAKEFWLNEWPLMADKTRSSILAGVLGYLHVYNTGMVRERISGRTTITPEVFDQGKWVLVDFPVANYGVGGAFIAGAWKYATERHVLRRHAGPDTPITVIWIDEYQNHITSFDFKYLSECRSHKGCMVVLTQSLHSYFASIGGKEAQSHAKGLLTNFGTKVFHALGDAESAEYAASLIGRDVLYLGGGGQSGRLDEVFAHSPMHTHWSQHFESLLQARAFMMDFDGRAGERPHGGRLGDPLRQPVQQRLKPHARGLLAEVIHVDAAAASARIPSMSVAQSFSALYNLSYALTLVVALIRRGSAAGRSTRTLSSP